MCDMKVFPQIVCDLEEKLHDGFRVFIIDYHDMDFIGNLCDEILRNQLIKTEVWCCKNATVEYDFLKHLLIAEMNTLLCTLHSYDFSDKVSVISDSTQYGSLFNYVKTGILSKDEMIEALLYNM